MGTGRAATADLRGTGDWPLPDGGRTGPRGPAAPSRRTHGA